MVDRDRILSKIAELDGYLHELDSIRPANREKGRLCAPPERKAASVWRQLELRGRDN